jgi:predicted transposase/invertase (TIGR01784 family)
MINFLNSVLPDIEGGIAKLSYDSPEKVPPAPKGRKAFFDLHCVTGNGERIIIEIQQNSQKFYTDRVLFYLSFSIQEHAKKGKDWKFKLEPLYSVNIVNFNVKKENPAEKYVSYIQLFDRETKELFSKNPTLVFLELPNLPSKIEDLKTDKEKWGYVIRNLDKMDTLPDNLCSEVFEKVSHIAAIAALSDKQRKAYYRSLKFYKDMNVLIAERDEEIQMYKQESATYQQMYQQEQAARQQEQAELAKLRSILALQGVHVNLEDKNIN